MKRRDFLKTSAALTAAAGVAPAGLRAAPAETANLANRDFFELRAYRLNGPIGHKLLDKYFEHAAIPALNRMGVKKVGVFDDTQPQDPQKPVVYVLLAYPTIELVGRATATLNDDPELQRAAGEYLQTAKDAPAFERMDSWLHLAFSGFPTLGHPPYVLEKRPRIFELRTYESHNELKALKKVQMFNSGEIKTMIEVGLGPIFYGQALIGRDLPHLTYMLSAENRDAHNQHWDAFKNHPTWVSLQKDPQYADTVSHITNRFLTPTSYSQI